jgi:nucleoid-associated protein YgaU
MNRISLRAASTCCLASLCAIALHRLGGHGLAAPHDLTPHGIERWVDDRGVATAAVGAVRLTALVAAAYLGAISALVAVVSTRRHPQRALPRFTPRVVRRALGLGVATVLSVPGVALAAQTASTEAPVLEWVGGDPSPGAPTGAPGPDATPPQAPSPAPPATWVVRHGDNFWSIAARTVEGAGAAATDAGVDRYWRALIAANADRLVVPGDPDLIFAGQELVLPPLR